MQPTSSLDGRSSDFGLPLVRGRLYFIGCEIFTADGENTNNTEGALDRFFRFILGLVTQLASFEPSQASATAKN